ncbi:MAG: hypothetical protein Q4G24_14710 [Paracoccus sp. (in: a-proteobacteria)]|uniref:hypothetical protein n=1 Tax=Paracoccus sp. TaxID=267 RepID=UPI0026DF5B82|nr:hypothetical protein [Paracoccus sp. (in: a-proteobacteria)]MDO5622708.1 hypothetical protein [Paracoccus sp. (in: a-proteobacteria)]
MTDLILHIGTEKTGSTSIQRALAVCRDRLAAQGVLYPRMMDTPNHTELALLGMGDRPEDPLQMQELARTGLGYDAYVAEALRRLDAEIAASGAQKVVLSNEHCHGRLHDEGFVARLHDHLAPRFGAVQVVVYLRRQDRMAVSHHSTRLREGGQGQVFPAKAPGSPFYDYAQLLDFYAERFGTDAITVRLFERDRMVGGDVVPDFFHTAALGAAPPHKIAANPSVSRQQGRFLTLFNARFPLVVNGALNPARGPVMAAIHNTLKGPQARPSRAQAEAFQRLFDDANDRLRARYLPDLDRPTLFDDSFDEYPEQSDLEAPLTEDEMLAFASALWQRKLSQ